MPQKFLASACLAGLNCKYNAGNNLVPAIRGRFLKGGCILVCPEVMGALPIPRPRTEISGGKIINISGKDVTRRCRSGAFAALRLADRYGIRRAVLKRNSPCCGKGRIFDGTFKGKLIKGSGLLTSMLILRGIKVSALS